MYQFRKVRHWSVAFLRCLWDGPGPTFCHDTISTPMETALLQCSLATCSLRFFFQPRGFLAGDATCRRPRTLPTQIVGGQMHASSLQGEYPRPVCKQLVRRVNGPARWQNTKQDSIRWEKLAPKLATQDHSKESCSSTGHEIVPRAFRGEQAHHLCYECPRRFGGGLHPRCPDTLSLSIGWEFVVDANVGQGCGWQRSPRPRLGHMRVEGTEQSVSDPVGRRPCHVGPSASA